MKYKWFNVSTEFNSNIYQNIRSDKEKIDKKEFLSIYKINFEKKNVKRGFT